jgi:glycosyltransferase involved in cell wall biosynthesis
VPHESKPPVVSVIVPTFNRSTLVGSAARNVLAQTFADLELLVVDDGSTDDTERVVRDIEDYRLHYHRLPENRGQAAARNHGLRRARGEYIAFQDSDDRWVPGKLERLVGVIRRAPPGVGCVYSDMSRVWLDGRVTYHRSPTLRRRRWIDPETQWYQPYRLGIQATLIPRRCLDAAGHFDERLRYFEDMELFLRLLRSYDFVHVAEPLTDYVQTPGVSDNLAEMWRARQRLLTRHARAILRESPGFVVAETLRVLRWRLGR